MNQKLQCNISIHYLIHIFLNIHHKIHILLLFVLIHDYLLIKQFFEGNVLLNILKIKMFQHYNGLDRQNHLKINNLFE